MSHLACWTFAIAARNSRRKGGMFAPTQRPHSKTQTNREPTTWRCLPTWVKARRRRRAGRQIRDRRTVTRPTLAALACSRS